MRRILLVAAATCAIGAAGAAAQEVDYTHHFHVFTGRGEPATLDDVIQAAFQVEAVLVGETHTDPVGHWIETELFRRIVERYGSGEETGALRTVALSLEMFERDVQHILDEYLQDLITEGQFQASSRPWEHYDSDYRPMVELAKERGVAVIAANAPRRYVNRVTRLGRDALLQLPPRARSSLPPLPYPQPSAAYTEEWTTLISEMPMVPQCPPPEGEEGPGEESPEEERTEVEGHPRVEPPDTAQAAMAMMRPRDEAPAGRAGMHGGSFMENALHAQALWDASMAYAITTFLEMNPGALVVHVVGGFHVKNHTGIPEKVQFYRTGTRSLVVHMEMADDFATFEPEEHAGRGDFVILTDKSLDLNLERNCGGQEAR